MVGAVFGAWGNVGDWRLASIGRFGEWEFSLERGVLVVVGAGWCLAGAGSSCCGWRGVVFGWWARGLWLGAGVLVWIVSG